MQDYEKLGTFYLGKSYDVDEGSLNDDLILYDSKDLTTHAVIIGMTGSGKTGLGIGMLEEAAIDKIPVIAIDPKGDMGNILLNFPSLAGSDFEPWVNKQEAANQGRTVSEFASDQAKLWEKGLGEWEQDKARIKRLSDTVDMAIYTPGSEAGIPVSVLRSFNAPPQALKDDKDAYRERVASTATSILALLDIQADPLTSREHILLANILQHAWDAGTDLDIPALITAIQSPPIEKIGVMDLDAVFPPGDRFGLAMRLNNLLAAPGFEVWMQGEALDAGKLFNSVDGKPKLSVMSIAHLSDSERMFFVTMLLNEIISWMRRQPGTGSLRAILYMDEIFGYMPPTANPPSKMLFLTLLKQARAYGVGLVLATQNPVDLDYKGLSNTGTWFIGRLQTERDKARVIEGLEGASAGGDFDRGEMEATLAGLGKRKFLLHNVHESEDVVFQTRWVLSYLAGPMTRDQIKMIMLDRPAPAAPETIQLSAEKKAPKKERAAAPKPALAPEIRQIYFPVDEEPDEDQTLMYYPRLVGAADVVYSSRKYNVHADKRLVCMTEFDDGTVAVEWEEGEVLDVDPDDFKRKGKSDADYAELIKQAGSAKSYSKWEKSFKRWIRNDQALALYRSKRFKTTSTVDETEGEFRARLQILASEERDLAVGKLRKKYQGKIATIEKRLIRAEQKLETEQAQAKQSKLDTAVSFGSAILGAFMGRKVVSSSSASRMGTAVRRAGRMRKQSGDVAHAKERVAGYQADIDELNAQFEDEVITLEEQFDAQAEQLSEVIVKAASTDIEIHLVGLAWLPYIKDEDGLTPAFDA